MNKVIEMFMFTLAIEWVYDLSSSFDGFPHSDSDICPSYVCNNWIPFAFLWMYGTYRHHILYKTVYVCPLGPRQGLNRPEWELYPVSKSSPLPSWRHQASYRFTQYIRFCYVVSRLFNGFNNCSLWSIIVVITLGKCAHRTPAGVRQRHICIGLIFTW
jgi:hypothetical protein